MKKITLISFVCIAVLLLSTGVSAANVRDLPKMVEISDIHNNELFEIVEEITLKETNYNMDIYNASFAFWSIESGKVSDNAPIDWNNLPHFFPVDKTFYDGMRLGNEGFRQCFLDADGNEIAFPKDAAYPTELSQYLGQDEYKYFREKQHYNCGYIHLAVGMSKLFAYTALYNAADNIFYYFPTVYTLREHSGPYKKYHVSAFDSDGNAILYLTKVWPGQNSYVDDVCYKIKLKKWAVVSVKYGDEKIAFDRVPVIEDGRTLVPLRAIFEKLGAEVMWDGATKTITATRGDTVVKLTVDNKVAEKNGESVVLDVPAKIIGGRTMVPVRFISDSFGVGVEWVASERCVKLTEK